MEYGTEPTIEHRRCCAKLSGSFILFEAIKRYMDQGLSSVDFVGVNSPMRGDFKTSFNAQVKPYYIVKLEKP